MTRTSSRRAADDRILARRLSRPPHWHARGDAKRTGICRKTGTRCSCSRCRINRRYYGVSVQERRQPAWIEQWQ